MTAQLKAVILAGIGVFGITWLYLRKSVPVSGDALSGARGTAGRGAVDMVGTTQPDKPGEGDSASIKLVSMRERARARVDQIRKAQEQLRAGAQPEEVKEPVK